MDYLIGIDVGTSGTKTVLFDENGRSIASSIIEYPMYQPQNGWAEQDPEDWWNASRQTMKEVVTKSGVAASDIKGIGISGQMHGLVMLDSEFNVLRKSIIWCDGRTGEECREITEKVGKDRLIQISANPALTGFTAGKILWVRKHEPEIYEKCRHILLPKDYIRYRLTGEIASEMSDASGTNLLDVAKRKWSEEILEILEIDSELMPRLYESTEVTGRVKKEVADETGVMPGTIVVGGAGDNAAAAVGTGVVKAGRAFVTIGTSGVIFAHKDKVSIDPEGRVHTFCHAVPNCWTVMSCSLAAGGSLKWFRDNFGQSEEEVAAGLGIDSYDIINKQVDRIEIGSDRLIFLPYIMGERSPILDEKARGAFVGLSGVHNKYNMLRSIMEGVTFSMRHCLEVLHEMGLEPDEIMATGGGGKSKLWRQMLSDNLNCNISTVDSTEGPALGVAILAGVGSGVFSSVEDACDKIIRTNTTQKPNREDSKKYDKFYSIYKKLYPALKESFHELQTL